jgi:hypothetical protein
LAGHDNGHFGQALQVGGVFYQRDIDADIRTFLSGLGCGKEDGFNVFEIPFRHHPVREDRAYHPSPSDNADTVHFGCSFSPVNRFYAI